MVVSKRHREAVSTPCGVMDLEIIASPPKHFDSSTALRIGSWNLQLWYRMHSTNHGWIRLGPTNVFHVGKGSAFVSVQDALASVPSGSTILVEKGNYFEDIVISKPVTLVSTDGANKTAIFGSVFVNTSNVLLDGFSVYQINSSIPAVSVYDSRECSVQNCKFLGRKDLLYNVEMLVAPALKIQNSSGINVFNNLIQSYKDGLFLQRSEHIAIQSNVFHSCLLSIKLSFTSILTLTRNWFKENLQVLKLSQDSFTDRIELTIQENVFEKNLVILDPLLDSRVDMIAKNNYISGASYNDLHFSSEESAANRIFSGSLRNGAGTPSQPSVMSEVVVLAGCDSDAQLSEELLHSPCGYTLLSG